MSSLYGPGTGNIYQYFRQTRENYEDNYLPRVIQDETNSHVEMVEDVSRYHYERRDDILESLGEYLPDKAKTKMLFGAARTYARRKPGHLAAKVVTRGIPYVGWALLVYDVIQLYQWYQD